MVYMAVSCCNSSDKIYNTWAISVVKSIDLISIRLPGVSRWLYIGNPKQWCGSGSLFSILCGLDPNFHFDADTNPISHQSNANLRPLDYDSFLSSTPLMWASAALLKFELDNSRIFLWSGSGSCFWLWLGSGSCFLSEAARIRLPKLMQVWIRNNGPNRIF